MPGEYAAIGQPDRARGLEGHRRDRHREPGRRHLRQGRRPRARLRAAAPGARARFGRRARHRVWRDFRSAEDPEAPVDRAPASASPTSAEPRRLRARQRSRCPTRASVKRPSRSPARRRRAPRSRRSSAASAACSSFPRRRLQRAAGLGGASPSRASRSPCSARRRLLRAAAPDGRRTCTAPGIDARGAAFAGISLYVLLGRGRDYAWSATSAGQDIIDTFAVELCEPDGSAAHARLDALPLPRRVPADRGARERRTRWTPSAGGRHPARLGDPARRAHQARPRHRRGPRSRASRWSTPSCARPTSTRPTRRSASSAFNDPNAIKGREDFQRAASPDRLHLQLVLRRQSHTAYFNSGNNPVRATGTSTNFPVERRASSGAAGTRTSGRRRYTPAAQPSAGGQPGVPRQLEQQAGARLPRGGRQLRLRLDLPLELARRPDPARASEASARCRWSSSWTRWRAPGPWTCARRRCCRSRCGCCGARAIRPCAARSATCAHGYGRAATASTGTATACTSTPTRSGSSTPGGRAGWRRSSSRRSARTPSSGWARSCGRTTTRTATSPPRLRLQRRLVPLRAKDLRRLLGRRVRAPLSRVYCGGGPRRDGSRARCRRRLASSLRAALTVDPAELYRDSICEDYGKPSDQWCYDAVRQRPIGAINQPLIHWINRPTFQQLVEVRGPAPR